MAKSSGGELPPPEQLSQVATHLDGSLVQMLEERRYTGRGRGRGGGGRGRGGLVEASKSYSATDEVEEDVDEVEEDSDPDTGRGRGRGGRGRGRGGRVEAGKSYSATDEVEEDVDEVEEDSDPDNEGLSEGADDSLQREIRAALLKSAPRAANKAGRGRGREGGRGRGQLRSRGGGGDAEEAVDGGEVGGGGTYLAATLKVGEYVAARYGDTVYVGIVEGVDPEDERDNYTLVKYMEKKGPNEYVWGKLDLLYTADDDLLCRVDPVVPVNNRTLGLNQDDFKKIKNIAQKMVYFHFFIYTFIFQFLTLRTKKYLCL